MLQTNVLVGFLCVALAGVTWSDKCFDIRPMANFNLANFPSNWLVHSRYPTSDWFERCTQWRFENNGRQGDSLELHKSTVNLFAESRSETHHEARQILPGEFEVVIREDLVLKYIVLDTDYRTFAVFYTCIPATKNSEIMKVWILTNGTAVDAPIMERATNVMKANNLTLSLLSETAHENCFLMNYYSDRFWILMDKTRKWTVKAANYTYRKVKDYFHNL